MLDKKGFDLWANGYDKSVNLSEEDNEYPFAGYKNVLNTIYNRVCTKNNAKILDIGFGTGILTKKLYDDGHKIWGVDFSERMIEISKEKMPKAKLFPYDFTKGLPEEIESQKFDFIISTYALHHLDDVEKNGFLNKLLNLLNKEGLILIGDVAFLTRELHDKCKEDCEEDGWDDEEFYFVFNELKRSFKDAEFTQISHCAGVLVLANSNNSLSSEDEPSVDKRNILDDEVFTYKITKDKKVFISWRGKQVTTFSGKKSEEFVNKMENASFHERQLIMAKVTGNFKRGNEKGRGN